MEVNVKKIVTGPFRQNCYVISNDKNETLIIDPGSASNEIINLINSEDLKPLAILNTHAHFDHIGAVNELMTIYNLPFYLHEMDKKLLSQANLYKMVFKVKENVVIPTPTHYYDKTCRLIKIGPFSVEVIETPGHTRGSVCLLIENNLFTGDTIFAKRPGNAKLPGGNEKELLNSLKIIALLSKKYIIYPGHGHSCLLGDVEYDLLGNVQLEWSEVFEKS